jgi:hypothetical protein
VPANPSGGGSAIGALTGPQRWSEFRDPVCLLVLVVAERVRLLRRDGLAFPGADLLNLAPHTEAPGAGDHLGPAVLSGDGSAQAHPRGGRCEAFDAQQLTVGLSTGPQNTIRCPEHGLLQGIASAA